MPDLGLGTINPFSNFKIGSLGIMANVLIVIVLAVVIIVLLGIIMWYFMTKKSYYIKIHVFKMVGNTPTRVNILRAREVGFGLAGDKLWRVAPPGFAMAFKIIKWLPVGKFQAAANEFWYWIRIDGEWVNWVPTDIDEKSKEAKIKFVQEDMRLQRLATEKLLEQRLMKKGFWEKYGLIIGYVVFFLVITIAIVIIFYQWSKVLEQGKEILSMIKPYVDQIAQGCTQTKTGLIPI